MSCPRCGTALEGRFCHVCGFDSLAPVYTCPRCGGGFTGYACPFCGLPLGSIPYYAAPAPAGDSGLHAVGSVVWSISLLVFLVVLIAELITLAYTAALVIEGSLAGGPWPIDVYVLVPFPTGFSVDAPAGIFLAYYLFLIGAILSAYAYHALKHGGETVKAFVRPISDLLPRLESTSGFLATGQVFLAVLLIQGIYLLALALVGFVPEVPSFPGFVPDWYPYYALANASVYEEIVTRWMFIGIPLFSVAFLVTFFSSDKTRTSILGKDPKPYWRHLFGGTINRHSSPFLIVISAIFVVFSAAIFGLAHVPSWGWWKFFPTFVGGVALGYIFLRSGLLAAILFHFATDYLAAMALVTEASLGAQILLGLLIILLMALGIPFLAWYIVYAARLASHFARTWGGAPSPAVVTPASAPSPPSSHAMPRPAPSLSSSPPAPPKSPYGGIFAFVCPRCGWREARYADGRFTCLRCGHVA